MRLLEGFVLLLALAASSLLPPKGAGATSSATPSLQRTRDVVTQFLAAYDLHHTRRVLATVTKDIRWGDCNYARRTMVVIDGKAALKRWLHKQLALHDQLDVSRIQPGGYLGDTVTPRVFGFDGTRTSDSLRAQGFQSIPLYFPKGVMNTAGTKIMGLTLAGPDCSPTGGSLGLVIANESRCSLSTAWSVLCVRGKMVPTRW